MHDFRIREPSLGESTHSVAGTVALLAPPSERAIPEPAQLIPKGAHGCRVMGHAVVLVVAQQHASQLSSSVPHRSVHATAKLQLEFIQFGLHLLAFGPAQHDELSLSALTAYVRKAQKIESLRLTFPASCPVFSHEATELDQARLFHVEFQMEPGKSFPHFLQELIGFGPVLESKDRIVGETDHYHRAFFCPLLPYACP